MSGFHSRKINSCQLIQQTSCQLPKNADIRRNRVKTRQRKRAARVNFFDRLWARGRAYRRNRPVTQGNILSCAHVKFSDRRISAGNGTSRTETTPIKRPDKFRKPARSDSMLIKIKKGKTVMRPSQLFSPVSLLNGSVTR